MDFSTRKTIRGLGIVGIIMLMVIGYLLVVQPFMAQATKHTLELNQVSGDRETAITKFNMLKAQKETIGQVEDHDDELSKNFPGSIDTPNFVSDLNSAASRSGTKISQVSVSIPALVTSAGGTDTATPPTPDAPADGTEVQAAPTPGEQSSSSLASITVDITAEGSVDELTKFTQELFRIDRNLNVNTVNLSREGDDSDKGTATFSATSYIYNTIPKVSDVQTEEVQVENTDPATPPTS